MLSAAAKRKGLSWVVAVLVLLAIAWVMPAPCEASMVAVAETHVRE